MKIMSIFGTRPEIIRLSRIFELLDNNFEHVMVNTSQNFTHELNTVFFDEKSLINGKIVWVSLKSKKHNIFPTRTGELEIIILPSFNRYFYATQKKIYKKSISPIIERMEVLQAKIVDLDGTIIGNESLLSQVI